MYITSGATAFNVALGEGSKVKHITQILPGNLRQVKTPMMQIEFVDNTQLS